MRTDLFTDPAEFLAQADEFLLQNEAGNNLILSIATTLVQNPGFGSPLLAIARDGSAPVAAMIWVPTRKLVMTGGPPEAGAALAKALHTHAKPSADSLPGLLSPPSSGEAFANEWKNLTGLKAHRGLQQTVMSLHFATTMCPKPSAPGRLRRAWLEDFARLRSWANAMVVETQLQETPQETAEVTRRSIESRRLFVWDDGRPVAMVGHSGHTPSGARINSVYVPPELRRRGFARAAVWNVSELLRSSGKRFVCLFADSHSPASLALYSSLGFKEIGALNEQRFKATDA